MIISAEWGKGIELKASKKGNSLFDFDLEKIPATAGIYIFIRSYGKNIHEPLYVGRATDLKVTENKDPPKQSSSDAWNSKCW